MTPARLTVPSLPAADLFIDPPVSAPDRQIEFSCRLVDAAGESRRIWFRFPADHGSLLTPRGDPFVLATTLYALGRFSRVQVHGPVSEGLFANLADFQAAYAAFHRLAAAPVSYSSTQIAEPTGSGRSAFGITAFSGGVDSCFSVFRHTALSPLEPKRPLRGALMMHGFDIPLEDTAAFARSARRSRVLTDEAGLRLFTGATNLRSLPGQWEDTFGTAVAAALAFFQPAFSFGLIPSFQVWSQAHFNHGSNPLTDPLLSSPSFAIVHDGASHGRIDKLRELAAWRAALRDMRVCWEGEKLDGNCCRCEKCLRTMLMLRVCGVTQPAAFPVPLDLAALDRLVIKNQSGLDEFAYLLAEARRLKLQECWIKPTERALRRNRRATRMRARARAVVALLPRGVEHFVRGAARRWLRRTPGRGSRFQDGHPAGVVSR